MTTATQSKSTPQPDDPGGLHAGLRITWIGSGVNLMLVGFKLWAGMVSGSQALVADGIHSLSDLFSDFVVILGLRWGRKHEDEDHPYGHGRIETISSMIIGMLLIVVGIWIAYNAIRSIYLHDVSRPSLLAIWAALFSILAKEGLFWWTINIGRRINSMALIGNAWHHRTDALSSIAVLIGVGATYINPNWHLADSIAALFVVFFVMKVGVSLTWQAFRELSDTAPDREVLIEIARRAERIDGVIQVHDLRARHSGSQIFVEMHIVVDPNISVREGHKIAATVKHYTLKEFADVTRCIIHVDPEVKQDRGPVIEAE